MSSMTSLVCVFPPGSQSCAACGNYSPLPAIPRNCSGVLEVVASISATLTHGPGTELKSLLSGWPFYITSELGCSCNSIASQMNEWGVEGCLQAGRMAFIVAAMRDNAKARGYLFFDFIGRLLVKLAASNAAGKIA